MIIHTVYCDDCEHIVKLTEDGYCNSCGKHYDNMKRPNREDEYYEDLKEESDHDYELGGEA